MGCGVFAVSSRVRVRVSGLRYIVDSSGNKIAVVVPIDEFNGLLEDLHDLVVIAERRDEPTVSFEEVKKRLKKRGIIRG